MIKPFTTINKKNNFLKQIILFVLAFGISSQISAATYTGYVKDAADNEPLPFVSIVIKGTIYGTETDLDGYFTISAQPNETLEIAYLGYSTKYITLKNQNADKSIIVNLSSDDIQLEEIEITTKGSYSKKNNPAVDLIKRVFEKKDENRIENAEYYQRNTYEKTLMGLTNIKAGGITNSLGLTEIVENADTSIISGKKIMYLSMKEKTMTQYFRKKPETKKQIVTGKKDVGIDEQIFGEGWLTTYMDEMFKDIDIYNSNIVLAFKPFVGPLSPIAKDYYKFFIKDTVYIDGVKCINLGFTPFNSANFSFMGYITLIDSSLAIKRVNMDIPKKTNINFLRGFHLEQEFEENELGIMELKKDELTAEFFIVSGKQTMYSQRIRNFTDYEFNQQNDSILKSFSGLEKVLEDAKDRDSTYWATSNPDSTQTTKVTVNSTLDKLQKNPIVKGILFFAELLIKGYLRTSDPSYFDIGPVYTMFSGSTVEGFRLRMGGETTANLSPNFFTKGYIAYGFSDNRAKYGIDLEYSLNKKSYHAREFPVNSFTLSTTNDIRTLGENPVGSPVDNWAYAIKRMAITNVIYYNKFQLQYMYEDMNGFSVSPWVKYEVQKPAGTIEFKKRVSAYNEPPKFEYINELYNNEIGIKLRYAPREKFVQGRGFRFNIKNPNPVFELTHKASFSGLLNSQYGYQATEFKYQQRYFLSSFGRIDLIVKAGKIWTGNVAFPYLFSPNANTSFTVMEESFSQVNPLEFAVDQYASIDIGVSTNGLLFNLIPGVKKLRLREVAGFKCYFGHLSNKNNPMYNDNLLAFPENTTVLNPAEPYMEFSVGIDNILNILRIDYVRRINYLDNPNIWKNGVRVSLNFTF